MTRNIEFSKDEYYHVYNRGTEKRNIFSSDTDYDRFLVLLYLANGTNPYHINNIFKQSERGRTSVKIDTEIIQLFDRGKPLVDVVSYCLMPNHFHLIVRERLEGGLSLFMQKLGNGYTGYFNKRNDRNGALFQGKFKATHIDNDNYLSYLLSYVHLNPIKLIEPNWKESGIKNRIQAEKYLDTYKYSSYLDYLGNNRPENIIISKDALPEYFETPNDFKNHIKYWMNYRAD